MPRAKRGSASRAAARSSPLEELIEISRAAGADPDLVQGGGGNTSVKTGAGTMLVKASGRALAAVDAAHGWCELDLPVVLAMLDDRELARLPAKRREPEVERRLESAVVRPEGARPSVESGLHALLDRVVIHAHPVGLNAFLSSRASRERYLDLIRGIERAPLYVPYVDPGYTLAVRVARETESYEAAHGRRPAIVLLENHGLFVARPDVAGCLALLRKVVKAGEKWAGTGRVNPLRFPFTREPSSDVAANGGLPPDRAVEIRGALLRGGAAPGVVRRDDGAIARRFVLDRETATLARKGPLTPDQIFYCGLEPLVLHPGRPAGWEKAVAAYRDRQRLDPRVVLLPGEGVYYRAEDLVQLKVAGEVFRIVMTTLLEARRAGGPRFLTRAQVRFIEEWKVDTFRSALLKEAARPLHGRVALVTGAASGLGKAIALGLIGAGATVFACDVDRQGLDALAAGEPEGRFVPVVSDVTNEGSVAAAFATVAASAGGLDFAVNAAGIAPAYELADFPLAAWKKALDINLTGYFLVARDAARLLLRQGAGGGIVNLTSKSGLEASKANSAYNATKAGEIHLMRGWALELGRAGIRVNCIAPGNVFKGSKIWNEEYIRVCAEKKGIRPEEVIPYYTAQSALGKEIEPEDIANAVVFLLSDAARNITGQTLVVDGGQVMVR